MRPEQPHEWSSEWPNIEKSPSFSEGRPGVGGFIVLCLLSGLGGLLLGVQTLNDVHDLGTQVTANSELERLLTLLRYVTYAVLIISVLCMLAAFLIARYRRLGLYLIGGLYLADIGLGILLIANQLASPVEWPRLIVAALILFQVYRYLTIPRFSKHFT